MLLSVGRLWHQATLGLEELVKDPVFQTEGNTDLLTLYREFLADQPSTSAWTGYASKMNAVKHASLAIIVSKQYGGLPLLFHPDVSARRVSALTESIKAAHGSVRSGFCADTPEGIDAIIKFLGEVPIPPPSLFLDDVAQNVMFSVSCRSARS